MDELIGEDLPLEGSEGATWYVARDNTIIIGGLREMFAEGQDYVVLTTKNIALMNSALSQCGGGWLEEVDPT
jgi:hypothetical protein